MNKDYINSWIDLALEDIDASVVLYENKLYSNSFYHFQQASEKGLKALAFITGIYKNEKDAYRTNHYTLSVFKSQAEKSLSNFDQLKQYKLDRVFGVEEVDTYKGDLKKGLNSLPQKKEIFQYSSKDLVFLLDTLEGQKKFKFRIPSNYDKDFKKNFENKIGQLVNGIKDLNLNAGKKLELEFDGILNNEEELKQFIQFSKKLMGLVIKDAYFNNVLYYCSIITHNHNNFSRYPQLDLNPLKYYNLRVPVVKKLPEFTRHLRFVLKEFKKNKP